MKCLFLAHSSYCCACADDDDDDCNYLIYKLHKSTERKNYWAVLSSIINIILFIICYIETMDERRAVVTSRRQLQSKIKKFHFRAEQSNHADLECKRSVSKIINWGVQA